jgi:ATP-dependent helicase/nuclease subunit A
MTYAQKLASDPSHSVYVSASAGSGKTKVLTDRVLRILLGGTPPAKIMCLTFTNAAAAEMANRINKSLMQWVVASDEELFKHIHHLTEKTPDAKTLDLARRLFVEVLETPDGLKIQTIHAFCQNLMRRFPLEADVAPHFTVIDERTSLELLKEARVSLLSGGGQGDEEVAQAIRDIAWQLHESSFTELLQEVTKQREKIEYLLDKYEPTEIIQKIYDTLEVGVGQTEEGVIAGAYGDDALVDELKVVARQMLENGSKTDVERGQGILAFFNAITQGEGTLVAAFEAYKFAFLTQKYEPTKKLATDAIKKLNPMVEELLRREQYKVIAILDKVRSVRIARLTRNLFQISGAVLDLYKTLKRNRAFLDYNDLIIAANKLLHKGDIAPWILYKLDGGIDHLLVDEAQDTSPAQWRVIESLCGEFFSGDSAIDKNRTVFIVGDEKQSIFSFQGADPKVFHTMQHVFADRAKNAAKGWQNVSLDMSFRSSSPVLQVVDEVFSGEEERAAVTFKDDDISHVAYRASYAGRVELWPIVERDEAEKLEAWAMPVVRTEQNNSRKKLADKIADTIKNWLDSGRIIEAKGRAVVPADIMILLRTRGEMVNYLVRSLKSRGVPVVGVDRMVLTEHIAIMDLIALGNFLLLPQDDLNLATLLKSPLLGLSEDELFTLAAGRNGSLWDVLRNCHSERSPCVVAGSAIVADVSTEAQEACAQDDRIQSAYTYLQHLLSKTDFLSPFGLYSYILEAMGGRKKIVARLGAEVNDPLDEFLSLALTYEKTHAPSLQGFLHWLDVSEAEVKRSMEQGNNEVRIMTVHGSKGLQAPIVFLPDAASVPQAKTGNIFWAGDDGNVMLWSARSGNKNALCEALSEADKEIARQEYLRLLYVALTRAEDELYIAGCKGDKGVPEESWYNVVKNAMEKIAQKEGDILVVKSEQKTVVSNDNIAVVESEAVSLPDFVTAPAPTEPSPSIPLAPSQAGDDTSPVQSPLFSKSVLRGKLIHKLLQYLPDVPPQERMQMAEKFIAKYSRELDAKESVEVVASAFKVLDDSRITHIFSKGSRAEVPIVGVVGKYVISGQIDRLLVTDTQVLIIDYKTNRIPPKNVADVQVGYLKQMAAYKAALARIYPDKTIACALVWTEGPEVMVLDDLGGIISANI